MSLVAEPFGHHEIASSARIAPATPSVRFEALLSPKNDESRARGFNEVGLFGSRKPSFGDHPIAVVAPDPVEGVLTEHRSAAGKPMTSASIAVGYQAPESDSLIAAFANRAAAGAAFEPSIPINDKPTFATCLVGERLTVRPRWPTSSTSPHSILRGPALPRTRPPLTNNKDLAVFVAGEDRQITISVRAERLKRAELEQILNEANNALQEFGQKQGQILLNGDLADVFGRISDGSRAS
jgi:hypothetical protein